MIQTILITGGAGFIGSKLALRLIANGHYVRVLDNLSPQIHGNNPLLSPLFRSINGKVDFFRGSVTSRNDLMNALHGIDTVVHLAAETGTGQSMYSIQHYSDVNINGTSLMLDLIANESFAVKKLIVASSRAVYGEGKYRCAIDGYVYPPPRSVANMQNGNFGTYCPICSLPVDLVATDEKSPVSPGSIYGITKLTQEQMVLTVGKALGISAIAFRYQNVYGPGQSLSNPYTGILSIFSTRIRNEQGLNIFEDGKESRDFVFIDDVVNATLSGIEHTESLVDVFNVGSGQSIDVNTLCYKLQQLLGIKVNAEISGQFRIGDIRHNFADLTKIRTQLRYEPTVAFEDGLNKFVEWVKSEQIQTDRYEESLLELKTKGLFK